MSTFTSLHFHIIFSTKHRKPWIKNTWIERLHEYIGGTIRGLDGVPQSVGGIEDHIHLLVGLKATHRLCDFMRELKKSSSEWVHESIREPEFQWQEGYAAFTLGATSRDGVRRYIANQREHHRKKTFQEELIELLERASVEYDPMYLDLVLTEISSRDCNSHDALQFSLLLSEILSGH